MYIITKTTNFFLGTWAEHNVIHSRMKKAWEAYFLETLAKKATQG